MSLESQVQDLVTQTQQLDQTVSTELIDVNTDISKLRSRVTALEIQIGLPDDNTGGVPGGGGSSTSNPGTNLGNDIIQIDTNNELLGGGTTGSQMPDVTLTNKQEFTDYRAALRTIALNPPVSVTEWPTKPEEQWSV